MNKIQEILPYIGFLLLGIGVGTVPHSCEKEYVGEILEIVEEKGISPLSALKPNLSEAILFQQHSEYSSTVGELFGSVNVAWFFEEEEIVVQIHMNQNEHDSLKHVTQYRPQFEGISVHKSSYAFEFKDRETDMEISIDVGPHNTPRSLYLADTATSTTYYLR